MVVGTVVVDVDVGVGLVVDTVVADVEVDWVVVAEISTDMK